MYSLAAPWLFKREIHHAEHHFEHDADHNHGHSRFEDHTSHLLFYCNIEDGAINGFWGLSLLRPKPLPKSGRLSLVVEGCNAVVVECRRHFIAVNVPTSLPFSNYLHDTEESLVHSSNVLRFLPERFDYLGFLQTVTAEWFRLSKNVYRLSALCDRTHVSATVFSFDVADFVLVLFGPLLCTFLGREAVLSADCAHGGELCIHVQGL